MSEAEKKAEEAAANKKKQGGELLFCGATRWNANISSRKTSNAGNLVSPTRLRPLLGVDIRLVVSGCGSSHCAALDVEGRCYTWGRNEKGQLGHGDRIVRDGPSLVSELLGSRLGVPVGDAIEVESSPIRCLVSEVRDVACGADFSVWLSSIEGASILTSGLPQYGQLGHGSDNECLLVLMHLIDFGFNVRNNFDSVQYNTRNSSVLLAYEAQPCPKAVVCLAGETIVKVACGTNHTVAVDSNGFVYTWGCGDYGRLGHKEQKDEWVPRRVETFTKHNVLPRDALIAAGSVNSACTAGGGQLYMWGKVKNKGDEWMYPKPVMDLSGWNIRCMDSGDMRHFIGAESSCISWGNALSGELGYGPDAQNVACGLSHSMVVVDRMDVGDRLDQIDVYDGKALSMGSEKPESRSSVAKRTTGKDAAKTPENPKRKKL
ncbi:hypothetical protein RHSIM_Rhsim07G0245600 [Rhododendron simsii]|uniref:Regulator of chromosome condensation n=1 Tax=Rhododendron simsii TaxID=118357 RepID=A0A834GM46_RHOSS|nr:hypothetical protein RHSIM_Rhsim07G0245600 [Rhododendron simsii]